MLAAFAIGPFELYILAVLLGVAIFCAIFAAAYLTRRGRK